LAGSSIAALSDSRTIMGSSAETLSPGLTHTSITSTSELSPRLGMAIVFLDTGQTSQGLGFAGSLPSS